MTPVSRWPQAPAHPCLWGSEGNQWGGGDLQLPCKHRGGKLGPSCRAVPHSGEGLSLCTPFSHMSLLLGSGCPGCSKGQPGCSSSLMATATAPVALTSSKVGCSHVRLSSCPALARNTWLLIHPCFPPHFLAPGRCLANTG